MGVPKRRMSKRRTRMRRSMWSKRTGPNLSNCPQCHELIESHRVCPVCGYYKTREVIAKEK